jgi:AcrR family transcriptional regulator
MSATVKAPRRYDSPLRREQAAATRQEILAAAQRLFERAGYAATTVPAIAAEAGVALKTVYLAFGTKANLLRALWDQRLAGDEAATPVLERRWYREVTAAADPQAKIRLLAKQSRAVKTRSGLLLDVIRNAAAVDPEIRPMWDEIQAKQHQVAAALVEQLHNSEALRPNLTPAAGTDMLWAINHPTMWQLLVRERNWSPDRYEEWLAQALCDGLLARK